MPFTPLHLAAGLPVKLVGKENFSLAAFVTMNVAIDIEPALVMLFDLPIPLHGGFHSLPYVVTVLIILAALCPPWIKQRALWLGGAWGGVSHLALDAIMHTDVNLPFERTYPSVIYGLVPQPVLDLLCLAIIALSALPLFLQYKRRITVFWRSCRRPHLG